uniref:Splicing factor 3A subunit 1 n=1 Tax=Ciona savignyi TaxID=51511 RepID=H2YW43_CIOSA
EPAPEESQSSKQIIGIIYPPPEVRNIVDKTASFVGRNGPEFEARIRQNEINNSKFNFLNGTDPYHAYYRHKVKEFIEGKGKEPAVPKAPVPTIKVENFLLNPSVAVVQEQFVPKDPPASFEFTYDPPSISAYELDVVRLTAQFVARNGRSFLTQLMQREAKNYQFDFLRPQHSMFQYFTKLVEQYTKIFIPPKNVISKLKNETQKSILEDVKYRVAWTKHEDRAKKREQQAVEKERTMYQIDWHDFVVVETVDFHPEERGNFPRPVSIDELGTRLLQQERIEKYGEEEVPEMAPDRGREEEKEESESEEEEQEEEQPQLVDMDMEESSEEEAEPEPAPVPMRPRVVQPAPPPKPPIMSRDDVIIRSNYNPKQKESFDIRKNFGDNFMVSPITGERVAADKFQEHMRYGLLDPNWKELKKKQIAEKQQEEEVFAAGIDIEASLRGLAERRTDIFGVEETGIGQKVGEEDVAAEDKVTWDGHSGSMEKTQRQAHSGVTPEEVEHHVKMSQGMISDPNLEKIGPKMSNDGLIAKPQPPNIKKEEYSSTACFPPFHASSRPSATSHQAATGESIFYLVIFGLIVRTSAINMIPVQRPNPVLVVQQPMHVVRPSQPQLSNYFDKMPLSSFIIPPTFLKPGITNEYHTLTHIFPTQQLHPMQQMMDGPPQAKKARTEADLMPAQAFIQMSNGPVTFRVNCPNAPEKTEWSLGGQTLTFTLPLTDEVSVIKAKIHEATGMPSGKQKLQLDGLFIKDSNSLAFYNMTSGSTVVLQVKERGGRKK